jgi:hypothetical protein
MYLGDSPTFRRNIATIFKVDGEAKQEAEGNRRLEHKLASEKIIWLRFLQN